MFNRKNTQKIAAGIIVFIVLAMVAGMILPYIV